MYTQFFKLTQAPFSIAPDPRYLFMSERHREALAHLLYGIGSGGGFVLLTGEIGAGKTTVCRCFMEQIPDNCKLAYIFNPKLSVAELLLSICDEFGIALAPQGPAASVKTYVDAINRYLLDSHAQAHNNVLIIDEAQNLSTEVLEQLRLLTNLETSERKLLQIILIGQPELRAMLARPELEQLAQRVIARYHLGSLTEAETGSYVGHRLAVAGAAGPQLFPARLIGQLYQLSKGVPRRINLLCDRALLGAYVENQPQVTRHILRKAAEEVFAEADGRPLALKRQWRWWPYALVGGLAGAVITGAAAWHLMPAASAPAHGLAATAPARVRQAALPVGAGAASAAKAEQGPPTSPPQVSSAVALRQLAAWWGLALPEGEPCPAAAKLNLRCLQSRADLAELRRLDRPALLVLHDDPAAPTYALLTALNDSGATLEIAGKRQQVAVAELERRYDGEFITFWRAPRSWRDEVAGGDRGPDVDWLSKRLAQIDGLKKPQENQALDANWLQRLRAFQLAQQLKADGVAGPKTFIRLNQLGGVQEPRLSTVVAAVVAGK